MIGLAGVAILILGWSAHALSSLSSYISHFNQTTVLGGAVDYHAKTWTTATTNVNSSTANILVAAASNRQSIIIQNNSLIPVWLGPSSTVTIGSGYLLAPQTTVNNPFTLNLMTPYIGDIWAVASSTVVTTSVSVNIFF